jgi:hypothetical protein
MAKVQTSAKKGPHRMATASKPEVKELDVEIDAFVKKAHATIEDARSKMSDEEVAEADRKAKAIFDRASAAARSSRHRA